MKIEIKHRYTDKVIISGEYDNIKDALRDNTGANLTGANLTDADLTGADLTGANLTGLLITISGSKNVLTMLDCNIWIGCEYHSIEYWKIMYDSIGEAEGYSKKQQLEYKRYIDTCSDLYTANNMGI